MILLKTKRLIIRKAELSDADFFLNLMNSPSWLKYIGDKQIQSLTDASTYLERSIIDSYQRLGYGLYVMDLIKNRSPIGICGFLQRQFLEHPDLGFAILPNYEGNGYSFEAATAIIDYGKSQLHLKEILAITTKHNSKSINLLKKLGMTIKRTTATEESDEQYIVFGLNKKRG